MFNLHIAGKGAIGLLFGSKISILGKKVTLLPRVIDSIIESSLTVNCVDQNAQTSIKTQLPIVGGARIDRLIVATKSFATVERMRDLSNCGLIHSKTVICFIGNGLGQFMQLSDQLDFFSKFPKSVLCITSIGARKLQDNDNSCQVLHTGRGFVSIGCFPPPFMTNKTSEENLIICDELAQIFREANLPNVSVIRSVSAMNEIAWMKLCVNCIINPLCTIFRKPNGFLHQIPNASYLISSLVEECSLVLKSQFPDKSLVELNSQLTSQVNKVIETSSTNINSMLADVNSNSPMTEVNEIVGHVVSVAKSVSIQTPLLSFVLKIIQSMTTR